TPCGAGQTHARPARTDASPPARVPSSTRCSKPATGLRHRHGHLPLAPERWAAYPAKPARWGSTAVVGREMTGIDGHRKIRAGTLLVGFIHLLVQTPLE